MPPDATEPGADLDIYVEDPNNVIVAQSTNPLTDELIDIQQPMAGTWKVWVHGWDTPGGDSDYVMFTWGIPAALGGNLAIDSAPISQVAPTLETVNISWTGAATDEWHLGAVSHTRWRPSR